MRATSLKHLCPEGMHSGTQKIRPRLATPTMKPIIVHHLCAVNPQLTTVVGFGLEFVVPSLVDLQGACPAHNIVVSLAEPRPLAAGILVVWCGDVPNIGGGDGPQLWQLTHIRNAIECLLLEASGWRW